MFYNIFCNFFTPPKRGGQVAKSGAQLREGKVIDYRLLTTDKVRARERESSMLELLQRAQPKLSEAS